MENNENRDKAIELYKNCIKFDPNLKMAYNNLGLILSDRGQEDEAI